MRRFHTDSVEDVDRLACQSALSNSARLSCWGNSVSHLACSYYGELQRWYLVVNQMLDIDESLAGEKHR